MGRILLFEREAGDVDFSLADLEVEFAVFVELEGFNWSIDAHKAFRWCWKLFYTFCVFFIDWPLGVCVGSG